VVFLISQIGTSDKARKFISELRDDEEIRGIVYCSKDDLKKQWEGFQKHRTCYTKYVSYFNLRTFHPTHNLFARADPTHMKCS
jgi:hypothetical protein